MSEITTATPTWATFKGHGKPERFLYLGRDRKAIRPIAQGTVLHDMAPDGRGGMRALTDAGTPVSLGGAATRFWALAL